MTEERASYRSRREDADDEYGVQHISEIIDQLVDQQDWSTQLGKPHNSQHAPSTNGRRRG